MSVKVKICGITRPEDAVAAAEAGAELIGFVFHAGSPRCLPVPAAAEIAKQLPPYVVRVGLFVNALEEDVYEATAACGLNLLQFHGDESPEYCVKFGVMSMKAFRIRDAGSLKALPDYATGAYLLDAFSPSGLGGTGKTFNWNLAVEAKKFGKPIFLAGGLTPENVAEAVRQVQPFGVDVSSGVESAPGQKDAAKVRAFINAVHSA